MFSLRVCSLSRPQGTGQPALLGLLLLEALKIELPWHITGNYQLPETQIPNLLVVSFWLAKEGASSGRTWQSLFA